MITCKNCGYDSHCGIPLIKDITGFAEIEQIEVCKYCRCEKCTKSEWGNPTTDME